LAIAVNLFSGAREMLRCSLLAAVMSFPFLLGCGNGVAPPPLDAAHLPVDPDGAIDNKLPVAAQGKQRAVWTVLKKIREGTAPEALSDVPPGITFQETGQAFFEGGLSLIRWRFNGDPSGDAIPVTLVLTTARGVREEDQAPKTVERVYLVTVDNRKHVTINRK